MSRLTIVNVIVPPCNDQLPALLLTKVLPVPIAHCRCERSVMSKTCGRAVSTIVPLSVKPGHGFGGLKTVSPGKPAPLICWSV